MDDDDWDDDWDDDTVTTTTTTKNDYGVNNDGIKKITTGRGSIATLKTSNNDWGNGKSLKNEESEWTNSNNNNDDYDESNDRRGRNGRGGGRGGRGGFKRDQNRDDGGKRRDFNNDKDKDDGNEGMKKPVEKYIPEERTTDEDLFSTGITTGVNFSKLSETKVKVSGEDVPNPVTSFENSGLRPHLVGNVTKSGYTKPTPIQKHSIPIIMKGRDLMGCAQTGSGKTAAFLLPIIHCLMASQEPPIVNGETAEPIVVIISPVRELTVQIYEQARKFSHNSIVKVVETYGGVFTGHQKNRMLKGCHILVATPGRLNDFVNRGWVSFASLKFFVLDEADRMLDMGFLPTVEQLLGHSTMVATGERQTLMFSATFPEEVQHLAGKFLYNYVFVAVGIVGSACTDVQQKFIEVTKFDKRPKLLEIIQENPNKRTLVFVETKRNADFIAAFLSENDIKTTSIHGDRLQREREDALWEFKKGRCPVMVATGVAARGLDIEGVEHVINFDLPKSIDEYVHRIGRTGRLGNKGKATSFFDPSLDGYHASELIKIVEDAGQEVPECLSSRGYGRSTSRSNIYGGRDIRESADFGRAQNVNQADEEDESW